MARQPGFFDLDERYRALSAAGDPLERLAGAVDLELFRVELEAALRRSDRAKGGLPGSRPTRRRRCGAATRPRIGRRPDVPRSTAMPAGPCDAAASGGRTRASRQAGRRRRSRCRPSATRTTSGLTAGTA
jgi:hypothetical protein